MDVMWCDVAVHHTFISSVEAHDDAHWRDDLLRDCGRQARRIAGTVGSRPQIVDQFLRRSEQGAQLSPRDRAMRRVSWNLANCHATVQKQVLNQVSAVANWPVRQNRAVDSAWRSVW